MFKFLKDKLKKAVSKFSKDVEEEAEDIEEDIQVEEEIRKEPEQVVKKPKPKSEPRPKKEEKEEEKELEDDEPEEDIIEEIEEETKPEELSVELQGLKEGLETYSDEDLDSLMSILGFSADMKSEGKEDKIRLLLKKPLIEINSAMDKLEGATEEPEEDILEEVSEEITETPEEEEKTEEEVEEKEEEILKEVEEKVDEELEEDKEEEKPKKKGFFGRLFSKKEEKEPEEEETEDEVEPPKPSEEDKEEPEEEPEFKIPPPEDEAPEEESEEIKTEEKEEDIDEEIKEVEDEKEAEEEKVEEEDRELEEDEPEDEEEEPKKKGFFGKLTEGLSLKKLSESKFEEIFFDIELALLENNVAVEVIEKIKKDLKENMVDRKIKRSQIESIVLKTLKKSLDEILSVKKLDMISNIKNRGNRPYVIVFVGINGSGKTTTIAKMAKYFMDNNMKTVMVAADTFRAAAIQQLEEHANNLKIKIIKHDYGSDPAAVAFDGIKYAESKGIDVVLIDTAGRLHSNVNLMDEMKKIIRVAKPDMKIFIGESITGNDCVEQAQKFNEAIELDGIVLSKADVDEKGGAAISVSYVTGKPILFLGTGQTYESLEKFDKKTILSNLGLD